MTEESGVVTDDGGGCGVVTEDSGVVTYGDDGCGVVTDVYKNV